MARPILFAHRGASAHARQNTLEAFRLAIELGAIGLESDVWLTADGVPVLDHDGIVPVRGVERPIPELPRAALPAHVPSLRELYEACGTALPLSLDVQHAAAGPATLRLAEELGAAEQLWLCHWSWRTVASWRALSPAVKLVDSTRAQHMRTAPAERAERMARLGIDAINLHHSDWRPAWIDAFRARGRRVFAWDAQDRATLERLLRLGVDAVYGDRVDRMVAALALT